MMREYHIIELWEARFEKILSLEIKSYKDYKQILERYSHLLAGTKIRKILQTIMRDEAEHIKIMKELIDITRNHVNYRRKNDRKGGENEA